MSLRSSTNIQYNLPQERTRILCSPSENHALFWQHDGNLVVYDDHEQPVWSSRTHGQGATHVSFQLDGNLVVYRGLAPLWSTGTWGTSETSLKLEDDGRLVVTSVNGSIIWQSQAPDSFTNAFQALIPQRENLVLLSSGCNKLVWQTDSNLVVYDSHGVALWASSTWKKNATHVSFQTDGNMVIYKGWTPLWSSDTWGNPGATLKLETDGRLLVRNRGGKIVWQTKGRN